MGRMVAQWKEGGLVGGWWLNGRRVAQWKEGGLVGGRGVDSCGSYYNRIWCYFYLTVELVNIEDAYFVLAGQPVVEFYLSNTRV